MPTFTNFDNDNTEIDPDHLEVNLAGIEPEPDQKNDAKIEPDSDLKTEEETGDEVIEPEQESDAELDMNEQTAEKESETDEVSEKIEEEKSSAVQKNGVDKVFLLLISTSVLLSVLFVCYFIGLFNPKDSLNISLENFQQSYSETSGYQKLKENGFSISNATFQPGEDLQNAYFSLMVENTLLYPMQVAGILDTTKNQVKKMNVMLVVDTPNILDTDPNIYSIFVPYIQVLYPDMSDEEAQNFLKEIYEREDYTLEKGRHKFIFVDVAEEGNFIVYLLLAGKDDPTFLQNM